MPSRIKAKGQYRALGYATNTKQGRPQLPKDITVEIGNRIKAKRMSMGMRVVSLARMAGINREGSTLSQIELGKQPPSILLLYRLSEVLDCEMGDLLP